MRALVPEDEQNKFQKDRSVFRSWKEDTDAVLKQALTFDFGYWRAARMVRPTGMRFGTMNRVVLSFRPINSAALISITFPMSRPGDHLPCPAS